MENKLIILNMKMYMDIYDVQKFIKGIDTLPQNVIVCPETMYIPYFLNKYDNIALQNIHHVNKGAYTGEVSALHAKTMGIKYIIIGHSERRSYFNETDEGVKNKLEISLKNNLDVVVCIGENLSDRESLKTNEKIQKQLEVLQDVAKNYEPNIVIAYEPVWAIGTGKIPTNSEIEDTVKYIKDTIKEKYDLTLPVVYGGSVNGENIKDLNRINNVDGFMIGGASTKVEEVNKIIEVVNG